MPTSTTVTKLTSKLTGHPERVVRVYVWELPVRVTHWIMVITLITLSVSGAYINWPFLVTTGILTWTMAQMRTIHIISAYIFTCSFMVRTYWFFAGNRFANWKQFIPVQRTRWTDARAMLKYYGFLRWEPVPEIGHNALAGVAYCWVWALCIIQIITGFVLLNGFLGTSPVLNFFVGWIPRVIDIQWIRATHYFCMFAFGAFFIHHIYSAMVISMEERSGLMDSIFTGYKFVPEYEIDREKQLEQVERGTSAPNQKVPAAPPPPVF